LKYTDCFGFVNGVGELARTELLTLSFWEVWIGGLSVLGRDIADSFWRIGEWVFLVLEGVAFIISAEAIPFVFSVEVTPFPFSFPACAT